MLAKKEGNGPLQAIKKIDLSHIECLSVAESFDKYADISLADAMSKGEFELVLCEQVEPKLGQNGLCFLVDYPVEQAALAIIGENGLAERWELYIAGLELANAYTELCDPIEQRQRFEDTAKLRAADHRDVYPIDEKFLNEMSSMPPCSGVALGIERLMMIFSNQTDIAELGLFTQNLT